MIFLLTEFVKDFTLHHKGNWNLLKSNKQMWYIIIFVKNLWNERAYENLLLVQKNMLRHYDNLENYYYRGNAIDHQLNMEKRMERMVYNMHISNLPAFQRNAGAF